VREFKKEKRGGPGIETVGGESQRQMDEEGKIQYKPLGWVKPRDGDGGTQNCGTKKQRKDSSMAGPFSTQ